MSLGAGWERVDAPINQCTSTFSVARQYHYAGFTASIVHVQLNREIRSPPYQEIPPGVECQNSRPRTDRDTHKYFFTLSFSPHIYLTLLLLLLPLLFFSLLSPPTTSIIIGPSVNVPKGHTTTIRSYPSNLWYRFLYYLPIATTEEDTRYLAVDACPF